MSSPTPCTTLPLSSKASARIAASYSSRTSIRQRLKASAKMLDFEVPYTAEQICAAKAEVLKANGHTDCYVRPIAWRGSEEMGVGAHTNKIHLAIASWVWPSYFDPEMRKKGIRLDFAAYRRPDPRPRRRPRRRPAST